MPESPLKAILQLNRLMLVLIGVFVITPLTAKAPTPWLVMGVLGAAYLSLLVINEFLIRISKRLKDRDNPLFRQLAISLPVITALLGAVHYAFTGELLFLALGFASVFQAQLLGPQWLSPVLALANLIVLLAGVSIGYPHPLATGPVGSFFSLFAIGWYFYAQANCFGKVMHQSHNQLDKLQSMAATDVLTGLTNRRQFNVRLHEEIARARRHETPLSLALFDLDDFKRLNDFYGHPVGDRILKEVGKLVRDSIRESDLPARYGGEEFAIILPETREHDAYELMDRIRATIAQTVFCLPENPLTVSISIGVAQLNPRHHTAFELVELTDKALYEAKKQGKNRVVKSSSMGAQAFINSRSDSRKH